MKVASATVTSEQLINDVIPKLKTVEFILESKLKAAIQNSTDAQQKAKYERQQQEFELELMMIQMNLDHLLSRYADIIKPEGRRAENTYLELDDSERVALSAIMNLYNKVSALASTL
ncbi:hypothetical protein [Pseudidiomarina woesei]|uniref:Uncharacterized protein n=1 Tax=Pseudidiomarina woesei TaxID=1381080 RepID=A0A0K6HC24_9GAMM|nr:hypothetical protein [Pseudidiomarina woesei]CUA88540.1 hypothetical protein Ga0061064_2243 [Pseudidiomarina woesei]